MRRQKVAFVFLTNIIVKNIACLNEKFTIGDLPFELESRNQFQGINQERHADERKRDKKRCC